MGLFNTKAGRRPPPVHSSPFSAASVAVDLVLLAAEDHGASQDAAGHGAAVLRAAGAGAGDALTYVGAAGRAAATNDAGLAAGLGPVGAASAPGLLVVELQVFQALGQGQLLLDGHAQQGVEGLLLVLGRRQLSLHLVQLGDVLVAAATGQRRGECWHGVTASGASDATLREARQQVAPVSHTMQLKPSLQIFVLVCILI